MKSEDFIKISSMEKEHHIYLLKILKNYTHLLYLTLEQIKIWYLLNPVQAKFRFRAGYDAVGAQNLQAIGLLLTQKIISVSSDGQRQFDIV